MTIGQRKLVGTLLLVVFITIYVLVAMVLGAMILPQAGRLAEFFYYALAGIVWVLPAGFIISWMHRG